MSDDYPIKYEAERLPPPIVADLNGDGKTEVLVATHDATIQVKIYQTLVLVSFSPFSGYPGLFLRKYNSLCMPFLSILGEKFYFEVFFFLFLVFGMLELQKEDRFELATGSLLAD